MKQAFNDRPVTFQPETSRNLDGALGQIDTLGTKEFAKALSQYIQQCDTPMTIGIQGDWGSGKTSLLNMIQTYLGAVRGKRFGVVSYNTWQYSQFGEDRFLGVSVIKHLLDEIRRQFNLSETDPFLQQAKNRLGNVLKKVQFSAFGFQVTPGDAFTEPSTPESALGYQDIAPFLVEFRDTFEKLIQHVVKDVKIDGADIDRVVIFIDDLDRVKPVKALELLEAIKNFLDVEDCVFVLAVDYEIVQLGMAEKMGRDLQRTSGKSFFDKIINLPFGMPYTSYHLGEYIKTLLQESGYRVADDELDFYEEITTSTVGRNPRSIKRVINYLQLMRQIRSMFATRETRDSTLQRKILYALICMQVAWPEIFAFFVKAPTESTVKRLEDWEFLDQIPFMQNLYDRSPDVEQLKSNISGFFDLLLDLLDADGNGHITRHELKPVWEVLEIARLTQPRDFRQPLEVFLDRVIENDTQKISERARLYLAKSKWATTADVECKLSGKRYATLVYKKRQIGSLVTLKSRPLTFRLVGERASLCRQIEDRKAECGGGDWDASTLLLQADEATTGFGDVVVDTTALETMTEKDAVAFLNTIFEVLV